MAILQARGFDCCKENLPISQVLHKVVGDGLSQTTNELRFGRHADLGFKNRAKSLFSGCPHNSN